MTATLEGVTPGQSDVKDGSSPGSGTPDSRSSDKLSIDFGGNGRVDAVPTMIPVADGPAPDVAAAPTSSDVPEARGGIIGSLVRKLIPGGNRAADQRTQESGQRFDEGLAALKDSKEAYAAEKQERNAGADALFAQLDAQTGANGEAVPPTNLEPKATATPGSVVDESGPGGGLADALLQRPAAEAGDVLPFGVEHPDALAAANPAGSGVGTGPETHMPGFAPTTAQEASPEPLATPYALTGDKVIQDEPMVPMHDLLPPEIMVQESQSMATPSAPESAPVEPPQALESPMVPLAEQTAQPETASPLTWGLRVDAASKSQDAAALGTLREQVAQDPNLAEAQRNNLLADIDKKVDGMPKPLEPQSPLSYDLEIKSALDAKNMDQLSQLRDRVSKDPSLSPGQRARLSAEIDLRTERTQEASSSPLTYDLLIQNNAREGKLTNLKDLEDRINADPLLSEGQRNRLLVDLGTAVGDLSKTGEVLTPLGAGLLIQAAAEGQSHDSLVSLRDRINGEANLPQGQKNVLLAELDRQLARIPRAEITEVTKDQPLAVREKEDDVVDAEFRPTLDDERKGQAALPKPETVPAGPKLGSAEDSHDFFDKAGMTVPEGPKLGSAEDSYDYFNKIGMTEADEKKSEKQTEMGMAKQQMDLARDKYIQAKKNARSLRKWAWSNIKAKFGKGESVDQVMASAGLAYDEARVHFARVVAEDLADNHPDYFVKREKLPVDPEKARLNNLIEGAVQCLALEAVRLSEAEIAAREKRHIALRVFDKINSNPLLRMAIGAGLNAGAVATTASGAFPLAALFIGAKFAMSAAGTERALSGVGEMYTGAFGDRATRLQDQIGQMDEEELLRRRGSFAEYRIIKQQQKESQTEIKMRRENNARIKALVEQEVAANTGEGPSALVANILEKTLLDQEASNVGQEDALLRARNTRLKRVAAGLLVGAAVTFGPQLVNSLRGPDTGGTPDLQPSPTPEPAGQGAPEIPVQDGSFRGTLNFEQPDEHMGWLGGDPNTSSLRGFTYEDFRQRVVPNVPPNVPMSEFLDKNPDMKAAASMWYRMFVNMNDGIPELVPHNQDFPYTVTKDMLAVANEVKSQIASGAVKVVN
jgi:hypothetical protein